MKSLKAKVIEEEDEKIEYHPIEELKNDGISENDIKKLINGDIKLLNLQHILQKKPNTYKRLIRKKIDKIISIIQEKLQLNIKPCIMVIKERNKIIKIITGSKKLDQLLGGGLESILLFNLLSLGLNDIVC